MAVTSEGRVALYLQDKHPIREGMEYVQLAEERGFEAVWQAESRLVREATVPMAAYRRRHRAGSPSARASSTTGRATSGCSPRRSRPSTTSRPAGSSSGSAPGGIRWPRRSASTGSHTLEAMRETVEAVRRLLAMERVTYHGEFVHLDDVEIDIVHGDRSPKHVPIYIGATAMKMMALAGEIADGVLLNYLVGPGYNHDAMAALAEGAARAGRTVDDIDRPQLVVCSLDDDRSLALDRARELVTQYLGQQPHIMKASGVDPSLLEEIGADPHLARDRRADRARDAPRPGRGRAADHRLRHRRRVPRQGARVRRERLHLSDPLSARRRRAGDARGVRGRAPRRMCR